MGIALWLAMIQHHLVNDGHEVIQVGSRGAAEVADVELLEAVHRLYQQGRYVEALRRGASWGDLRAWPGPRARVM
ncbi:MAG: hypothetical protein OEY14_16180, partial [Myxococcales bacterium]|nr:hypothetical protein [Myxococcales bacterium]